MTTTAGPGVPLAAAQPQPAPISARRAYTEVLLVFAATFGASIINGAEALFLPQNESLAGWADYLPAALDVLSQAGLIAVVVILLSARRGMTPRLLGVTLPRKGEGTAWSGRAFTIMALALAAFIVGGIVTTVVTSNRLPQPPKPNDAYVLYSVAMALNAGVIEELVALTFVISTLRQARRPVAEVVIVAVLLRCTYHDYYGIGVLGIVIWATAFALIYLRFRSVLPLIMIHFLWDTSSFLTEKWPVFGGLSLLLGLALLITGLVTGVVGFASRASARSAAWQVPAGYPPGPWGYGAGQYPPVAQYPQPQWPQAPVPPYAGAPQTPVPPYAGGPAGVAVPYGGAPAGWVPPYAGGPAGVAVPYGGAPAGWVPPYAGGQYGVPAPYGAAPQATVPPDGGVPSGQVLPDGGVPPAQVPPYGSGQPAESAGLPPASAPPPPQ